jgi:hypothetical protein
LSAAPIGSTIGFVFSFFFCFPNSFGIVRGSLDWDWWKGQIAERDEKDSSDSHYSKENVKRGRESVWVYQEGFRE